MEKTKSAEITMSIPPGPVALLLLHNSERHSMLSSIFSKQHPKVGARPGTLAIANDAPAPVVRVIHYTPDQVTDEEANDAESLRKAHSADAVTWVDVQGFGDEKLIRKIGEVFALHPLAIEEVVNVPQRPKAEPYDEQLMIILRMVRLDSAAEIDMEQVSIVLGKNYVLTFQERYGDILDPVRKRICSGKGVIRRKKADYLAYAIFDTIVDGYYPVLEQVGNWLEALEDAVVENPTPQLLRQLNQIKIRLTNLRRAIWPQREVANNLCRDDHDLIDASLQVYLRDTYNHCVQTSEVAEMFRDIVTGLMNTYLSSVANRTNEVMKVLTIVATTFIPLTFLAGIYGMNFDHMPELHARWGYPLVCAAMLVMGGGMLIFFWRKGWISAGNDEAEPP